MRETNLWAVQGKFFGKDLLYIYFLWLLILTGDLSEDSAGSLVTTGSPVGTFSPLSLR